MQTHPTNRSLTELLAEAGIAPPPSAAGVTVSGISTDSRRVRAGELFIAINGLHVDARAYMAEAAARGAVAVVAEEAESGQAAETDLSMIGVPNARVAAACLYDAWYGHPTRGMRLVGVTGTNGKTSVSFMLRYILRAAGIPCGLVGTVGCYSPGGDALMSDAGTVGMTTPDPAALYACLARMAEDAPDDGAIRPVVVMEVTSHALTLGRVAPLVFDLAVFTNLTPEHLDLHGTMEAYYEAKRRLFAVSRAAVVNADDRYGRMLLSEPVPVRHWHICHAGGLEGLPPDRLCPAGDGHCTRLYAEQINHLGEDGVGFKLTTPDVRVRLRCPVPGPFTVMNALEASAAALALGVSPAVIREALRNFPGVPGRMERVPIFKVRTGDSVDKRVPFTVFIDFAHTPDALEKLLSAAHAFRRRGQRIVLVFGCGGDRDRSKRKVMGRIASRMADYVVITSDNSRSENPGSIIADILEGVDKESTFEVIVNRREAIRTVIRDAREGDIILLAGKGHETYEITATGTRPFCERCIVLDAVKAFWRGDGA